MGIQQGRNLYVGTDGKLEDGYYLPAFVRRYPFVFASETNSDRLVLCVDRSASMISEKPEIAFFKDDKPSDFTLQAMKFCEDYERQRRATDGLVQLLKRLDLFESKTVTFQPRDRRGRESGPPQLIGDFWAVSEERLGALPEKDYMELRESGAIGACYAHFVSLLNWQRLMQRAIGADAVTH